MSITITSSEKSVKGRSLTFFFEVYGIRLPDGKICQITSSVDEKGKSTLLYTKYKLGVSLKSLLGETVKSGIVLSQAQLDVIKKFAVDLVNRLNEKCNCVTDVRIDTIKMTVTVIIDGEKAKDTDLTFRGIKDMIK
jgi:hypothetical protein